tara:strand:+ start:120229 stop:121083 length:855 start_codon:yes stop_codon:yes gene_type:complete
MKTPQFFNWSKKHLLTLMILPTAFTACKKPITDDPVSALNGLVKEYGFIGYQNPMETSGTGTMLAGRPTALSFVAPPEDCFSNELLPRNYDTSNFRKTYNYQFQGNLGFLAFGTPIVSAGLGLNNQHTVEVELNGITIEYMSSIGVTEWYRDGMRETCREYLDDVGFVIQALITDSMKISIKKVGGLNIGLNSDNVADYFEFEAGVDWQIVDEYSIEISTPKYIGYQLGRLRLEDDGRVLYRAKTVEDDQFIFEAIGLFDDPVEVPMQAQQENNEMDENSVFVR